MTASRQALLPTGWVWAKIDDLVASDGIFIDGDWVESKDQDPKGDVRLIQLADVGDARFLNKSSRFLTTQKANELRCTFLHSGDVLVARMPDPLGRACIFPGDPRRAVTVVDVAIVRTGASGAHPRWLMWAINAPPFRLRVAALQSGSTRKRISRGNLATVALPVAPLAEQHRIVAEIEKQFTRLDAGVAALERVRTNLKRYRAAVLKAAVEGRLVPTEAELARREGREYEPAALLLAQILEERRNRWRGPGSRREANDELTRRSLVQRYSEPKPPAMADSGDLPQGWAWATLEQLTLRIADVDHVMPRAVDEGVPYVSTRDFVGRDGIDLQGAKRISLEDYERLSRKVQPEPGDLLLSRYGTVGEIRMVPPEVRMQASYSLAVLKTITSIMPTSYLLFALRADFLQEQMRRSVRASGQPDLGLEYIRRLTVPLPSLAEQSRIVIEVERLLSLVDEIETNVDVNLKRAERLRQAILKRAFEGRLAPQDPDDEPASVLLERIRAERAEANEQQRADRAPGRTGRRRTTPNLQRSLFDAAPVVLSSVGAAAAEEGGDTT